MKETTIAIVAVLGIILVLLAVLLFGCGGSQVRPYDPTVAPVIANEHLVIEGNTDALSVVIEGDLSYWIARLHLDVRLTLASVVALYQSACLYALERALFMETLDCVFDDTPGCRLCLRKPTGYELLCIDLGGDRGN